MNFERFVVLLFISLMKGEVNFFISRGFLEVFCLPSAFIRSAVGVVP